jgi:hypothetical protein
LVASQYIALYYSILYPAFRNDLLYDPEIRVTTLFDIGGDNSAGMIAGAIIGAIAGAGVIGFGVALAFSRQFRRRVMPFFDRATEVEVIANTPRGTIEADSKVWQNGNKVDMSIRNTHFE